MTAQPKRGDFDQPHPVIRRCPYCFGTVINWNSVELDQGCQFIRWPGLKVHIAPAHGKILATLLVATDRHVSLDELTDVLWGDREDGGPDDPRGTIRTMMCHVVNRTRRAPFVITTRYAWGYRIVPRAAEIVEKGA